MTLNETAKKLSVSIPTVKKYISQLNLNDKISKQGRSLIIPEEVYQALQTTIPKTSSNTAHTSSSDKTKSEKKQPPSKAAEEIEKLLKQNQSLTEELNLWKDKFNYLDDVTSKELDFKDKIMSEYENEIDFLTGQIEKFRQSSPWKKLQYKFYLPRE